MGLVMVDPAMFAVASAKVAGRGHGGSQATLPFGGEGLKLVIAPGAHEPVGCATRKADEHQHRDNQVDAPRPRAGLAAPGDVTTLLFTGLLFPLRFRFGHGAFRFCFASRRNGTGNLLNALPIGQRKTASVCD